MQSLTKSILIKKESLILHDALMYSFTKDAFDQSLMHVNTNAYQVSKT